MKTDYDVIILGSGPAGFSCSIQSAKLDKRVLVIEANDKYLGGAWINTGTVPSKSLREAANIIFKYNRQLGQNYKNKPYAGYLMEDLLQFKDKVQENENKEVKRNLIENNVHTARGYGKILDEHTVEVTDYLGKEKTYSTEYILISTGSHSIAPQKFTIDNDKIFDINSIFSINHVPRRLVIVGSGVNAIEFATTFAAMGTHVSILNENKVHLGFLDKDVKSELNQVIEHFNIYLYNNSVIESILFNPIRNCTEVRFMTGSNEFKVIESEHVLYLGGRVPNTRSIGLDNVNVGLNENGYIRVDENYCSSVSSIYAAGDVIGFPSLASASFTQGRLAACHMFNSSSFKSPANIPFGIYSIPEISSIGLTEQEAQNAGMDYSIGRAYFKNLTRANINNMSYGILKLIFETKSLKLIGVHILGEHACDLIHLGQSVLSLGGDINYFVNQVFNYPTYTEAYKAAAFNGLNQLNQINP